MTSMAKTAAALDHKIQERKTNKSFAVRELEETRLQYERVLGSFDVLALYETSMIEVKELERRQGELIQLEQLRRQECEELKERLSMRYHFVRFEWRSLVSIDFENFLSDVFIGLGFEVQTTKASGDQGVDLVLTKSELRIAVQAKGYPHSTVGNDAVMQVVAGMNHYRCARCVVVTNSTFTRAAVELGDEQLLPADRSQSDRRTNKRRNNSVAWTKESSRHGYVSGRRTGAFRSRISEVCFPLPCRHQRLLRCPLFPWKPQTRPRRCVRAAMHYVASPGIR